MRASVRGAAVGIPPFMHLGPNRRQRATGQCQSGSLTGAVASQRVTEAPKDTLSMDGNHASECKRKREPNCEIDESSSNESWS